MSKADQNDMLERAIRYMDERAEQHPKIMDRAVALSVALDREGYRLVRKPKRYVS